MKMRSDLAGKEKLKRKWVRGGREIREAEHKCEQRTVNRDDQKRELEQVNITISMTKEV